MALFTDGPINGTKELQDYENGILDVASSENIDLTGKVTLAQKEIANELMLLLIGIPRRDFRSANRRVVGLMDVVVTEPLIQWHAHKTLALVYRDAYNNQLNDRYRGKWTEYEELARSSSQTYLQIGVGLVADPISKALTPMLSTVAGAAAAASYYVAVTWLNGARQEGCPSDVAQISTVGGQQLVVTPTRPPTNATAWNVYVGDAPDTVTLQNQDPISIGTSWTMTGALRQGTPGGRGQLPERFLVNDRLIQRG